MGAFTMKMVQTSTTILNDLSAFIGSQEFQQLNPETWADAVRMFAAAVTQGKNISGISFDWWYSKYLSDALAFRSAPIRVICEARWIVDNYGDNILYIKIIYTDVEQLVGFSFSQYSNVRDIVAGWESSGVVRRPTTFALTN